MIPPAQARKVDPSRIFRRPSWKVRTDKNQGEGDLAAKSRIVLPGDVHPGGHLLTEEGGYRTDAPTASQIAFHSFCSNAVRRRYVRIALWSFMALL